MKCSVIIPYYKRKNLVLNTLKCLENQTFNKNDFEVILVEDGSSDFNLETIKTLNLSINLNYISSGKDKPEGSSYSRNLGIKKAQGEILIFIDCDMLTKPNFIEEHYRFHQEVLPEHMIVQIGLRNYLYHRQYPNLIENLDQLKENDDYYRDERYYQAFQIFSENLASIQSGWNKLYSNNFSIPRTLCEKYGSFDEKFKSWGFEDEELGYRYHKNGVKIAYNPNITTFHQYHSGQGLTPEKIQMFTNNLMYFMDKHNDIPVVLFLKMISEGFKVWEQAQFRDLNSEEAREVSQVMHSKYETCLRILYTENQQFRWNIIVQNPTIDELKQLIKKDETTQYTVICPESNISLIAWIQTNCFSPQILLYTTS